MKQCYIIAYYLCSGVDSQKIIDAIKSYGIFARITEDVWAIVSDNKAPEVRNFLKSFVSEEDRIFVIKSGFEAAWSNVVCGSEWLKEHL